jgi:cyclophilin family peptidyl-prolyl cis-trans isomerase
MFHRLLLVAALVCLPAGLPSVRADHHLPDGLYARFSTSKGDFTCELDYTVTPRTVANFVLLAETNRTWGIDLATGTILSNAVYQGGLFHRVVSNHFVQAGNPASPASARFGYAFDDEFTTEATTNVVQWSMAMANAGPDTNGSGFFIMCRDEPGFNNRYTVFGRVVEGTNVIREISLVPADRRFWPPEYSIPKEDIVIHDVTVLRVGTEARDWDPGAVDPPLPEPFYAETILSNRTGSLLVIWGDQGGRTLFSFDSLDLTDPTGVDYFNGTGLVGASLEGYQDTYSNAYFWTVVKGSD